MIQVTLLSEELFKLNSPITKNTDITEFIPYIVHAQKLHIEPILGDLLMAELKLQIESDTLTPDNGALILKIAPCLSFYAVYQGLPFHWASIVNKGVTIRESENSKGVDVMDIAQLRRWVADDAQTFKSQLIDFLCKCRSNYPLWNPSGCCDDRTNEGSAEKKFESGFYFPSSRNGCNC